MGRKVSAMAQQHKCQSFWGKVWHPSEHRPHTSKVYLFHRTRNLPELEVVIPTQCKSTWKSSRTLCFINEIFILYNTITISISYAGFRLIEFIINMFKLTQHNQALLHGSYHYQVPCPECNMNIWYRLVSIRWVPYSILEQQKTYGKQ